MEERKLEETFALLLNILDYLLRFAHTSLNEHLYGEILVLGYLELLDAAYVG